MSERGSTDEREGPRASPGTDPTNPCSQEKAGTLVQNERSVENAMDEPGLTDRDREARDPGKRRR